jgi:hypothetical protein
LGNDACLWKAVHPLLDLTVDVAIVGGFVRGVGSADDVVRHVGNAQAHVLKSGHRGVQIEILDVHRHEFCAFG